MHMRRPIPELAPSPGGSVIAQLLALQVIRRSMAGAEAAGWREVGTLLRAAHARMLREQQVGLVVGGEANLLPTRHERGLLRATAAAQAADPALVDNHLFALAPRRALRPLLAAAVGRLAAGLTRHGHALPPSPTAPVLAPAAAGSL